MYCGNFIDAYIQLDTQHVHKGMTGSWQNNAGFTLFRFMKTKCECVVYMLTSHLTLYAIVTISMVWVFKSI